MTAFKGLGTYGNAAGVVTPLDHKLSNAGQFAKTGSQTIRTGLVWGGVSNIVTGTAGMSYSVAPYQCVTQRSGAAGAVPGGNDGTVSVATTAAPGSNSRWDVVYHWHREYSLDGVDSNPVIGVIQGTAAASPTVPSLAAFPGAIELSRILVPTGVTATNSGTTITQSAPFTAMAGGVIPFRNSTERDAGTFLEGQLGWLIDTDQMQYYSGAAWISFLKPQAVTLRKSLNQNLTASLVALTWDVEISDPVGMHDNVSNTSRLVAVEAGLYEVCASLYNNNTSGLGNVEGRLNGTTTIPGSFDRRTGDGGGLPLKAIFSVALSAGDYVEIMVQHATAAGAIEGGTTRAGAIVTMKRVGP